MNKRDTLLIVDDMEVNRAILRSLFERQYNILEAENGEQALILIHQYQEYFAAVLLDLVMPVKDGYEVMEQMRRDSLFSKIPVVVITSDDTPESEMRAFDLGASDIITKPFEPHVVKRRVQNIVDLYRHKLNLEDLVEEQSASLRESNAIIIDALSSIIEYRSLESGQHIRRIRMFTRILLENVAQNYQEYNLDERTIGVITNASSLHDIGKIAIPDSILNKPGPLTKEEFEIMKTHSLKGCEMLSNLGRMNDKEYLYFAYNICRCHHERWDGKGYPDGLKGDNIPICAQVVAIADCYDALTTDRVYKKAIPSEQAFNMILNGECGAFSPRLLECFKAVREEFARLSRDYSDAEPVVEERTEQKVRKGVPAGNLAATQELGQSKYFALLRYVDSTVMELDIDTGVYHMVYMNDQNFELLRLGSSFEESLRIFTEGAVHPEDREKVLELLGKSMDRFFADGLMKYTLECRVLNKDSGKYIPHRVDLLRIDIDNPRQRKVFLIWSRRQAFEGHEADLLPEKGTETVINQLVGGILKVANDRWLTISEVNQGFFSLLLYTEKEILEKFHSHYIEMIYPADRERVRQEIAYQLNEGRYVRLEYRMTAGDGRIVWVMDHGQLMTGGDGREYFYSVLIDITESRQTQEELRLSLERHKIILDQTNDIIFEWDINSDEISFSNNWEKKYGYRPITEKLSERLPLASHIHPDDIPEIMKDFQIVREGGTFGELEFRLADHSGKYSWRKVRAKTQFSSQGKPVKAVGIITDIDDEKRTTQLLREKAERDVLTKLFNKRAARKRIISYLNNQGREEVSAMMIIDVDNFKLVNDTYGHMFGDAVLSELSARISGLFRDTDIVSRIGGDEFMVFMPGIPSEEVAKERAERMTESFQGMLKESLKELPFSCSIGVAYAPADGRDFQTLFQNSDAALYQAKMEGKNRFVEYKRETAGQALASLKSEESARDSHLQKNDINMSNVINLTFRELYETGDFEQAVETILEMVGKLFHVERVYIFENPYDNAERCSVTFEWHEEGTASWDTCFPGFSYQDGESDYRDNFDENGLFYCPDTWRLSDISRKFLDAGGVCSTLQCAVFDGGKFRGFVGFDSCSCRCLWTQEQIDCLSFLSRMLSVFLLKRRAQNRVMESMQNLKEVLDSLNSWIYVVDTNSCHLLYLNRRANELTPGAQAGRLCCQALFEREEPCSPCIIHEIAKKEDGAIEVYHSRLDKWVIATGTRIPWGDKEAYLLVCQDISRYKK